MMKQDAVIFGGRAPISSISISCVGVGQWGGGQGNFDL